MTVKIRSRGGVPCYDINVMGPAGPVRERRNFPAPLTTESARERWLRAREAFLAKNGLPVEEVPAPTLRDFGPRWIREYCIANGHKPSTIFANEQRLRKHIYPVLGALRLDRIGAPQVQKLKLHMAGKADKTVACVLALLATILHTAERWDEIKKAPTIKQPRPGHSPKEFYDFDEWERLVEGARKAGPMVLCMVLLGGEAGLRRGEMIALEQGDIGADWIEIRRNEWNGGAAGGIHVGTTKGGHSRRVPMTARLKAAIAAVRHLRGPRLLWQDSGGPVGAHTLRRWLERASRAAGLPLAGDVHRLRHTFCSHLSMRGAPVTTIQKLAGHADLSTTSGYMHLAKGSLDAAIGLLEQGWSKAPQKGGFQR